MSRLSMSTIVAHQQRANPFIRLLIFMLKLFYNTLFLFIFMSSNSMAEQDASEKLEEITHWSQFTFENDALSAINKSDDGYSNGIGFSWGRSDYNDYALIEMPSWLRYMSEWTFINQGNSKQYSVTFGVSQLMYTPDKIEENALIDDDRPYAGTLLWSSKLRSYANNRANSLGLILGVAGPASLAEQSQTVIHTVIDATIPKGWDHQIKNELVLRVEAEHIERFYRYSFSDNLRFDSSSYSEVGVGNLRSDVGTGVMVRIGNMLDQTYESINPSTSAFMSGISMDSGDKFYWQLFTVAYGSYVFNDISLTGNTFSDSHSVKLVNEQLMVSIGAAAVYQQWGFVFSVHRGNKQFEGQANISKYGSLTISYHY